MMCLTAAGNGGEAKANRTEHDGSEAETGSHLYSKLVLKEIVEYSYYSFKAVIFK